MLDKQKVEKRRARRRDQYTAMNTKKKKYMLVLINTKVKLKYAAMDKVKRGEKLELKRSKYTVMDKGEKRRCWG